jgi:hypothetical protein
MSEINLDDEELLPPYDADDNYIDSMYEYFLEFMILYQEDGVTIREHYEYATLVIETDCFEVWIYPFNYNGNDPHGLTIKGFTYNGVRKVYNPKQYIELQTKMTLKSFVNVKRLITGEIEVMFASKESINKKVERMLNLKAFL